MKLGDGFLLITCLVWVILTEGFLWGAGLFLAAWTINLIQCLVKGKR